MSVHYSSAVWKCCLTESSCKLVLLKLADCAGDDGLCWPSLSTIARDTGLGLTTVKDKITWLVNAGLLIRRTSSDRVNSNRYVLSLPAITDYEKGRAASGLGRPPAQPPNGLGYGGGRLGVGLPPAGGRATTGHEPSLNHQGTVNEPPGGVLAQPLGSNSGGQASGNANGSPPSHPDQAEVSPEKKERGGVAMPGPGHSLFPIRGKLAEWVAYKRQSGKGYKSIGWYHFLSRHAVWPPAVVAAAIDRAMASNWAGIFPEREGENLQQKNGGGGEAVSLPVVSAPEAEPEGWLEAAAGLYGPATGLLWTSWAAVPGSNKTDILKVLKKKKGGGHV